MGMRQREELHGFLCHLEKVWIFSIVERTKEKEEKEERRRRVKTGIEEKR